MSELHWLLIFSKYQHFISCTLTHPNLSGLIFAVMKLSNLLENNQKTSKVTSSAVFLSDQRTETQLMSDLFRW